MSNIPYEIAHNENLVIDEHNIKLVRFNENILETVRHWRNSPEISQYMTTQTYISKESQLGWFNTIRQSADCFYFVIYYNDIPIGACSIFEIDYDKKLSNVGCYIAHPDYINSGIGVKTILLLAKFAFMKLGLDRWETPILNSNKRAIRFNQFYGAQKVHEIDSQFSLYKFTKETYLEKKETLKDFLVNF